MPVRRSLATIGPQAMLTTPNPVGLSIMEGDDLSGSVIAGRYAIQREIGRGGTATLYLATDLRYEREVALKVLRHELTGSIAAKRFTSEITTAARLSHPLIVALHDSGEWEGRIFFVMQYVEGDSLRRYLDRKGPLPIDQAIDIACEVAEALEFAHRRGVVHRDIKPANILLHAGHAAVADFGIALALDRAGEGRLTAGYALGTPPYMSPEQTYGDRELDARTDIYSLGCVLYEMLAGAPPFREPSTQAVITRHRDSPPPPLRPAHAHIPPALEQVVMRALAKDPADRFASAKAFEDAILATRASGAHTAGVGGAGVDEHGTVRPLAAISAARRSRARRFGFAGVVGMLAVLTAPFVFPGPFSGVVRAVQVWLGGGDPVTLDRQLVTVAPFYVPSTSPELQQWKDALARVLASSLDGSGSLRVSSLSGSFKEQPAVTDRDSAVAIGRRTRAGFVIWGTVLDEGPDAVRVTARILDVGARSEVDEVTFTARDPGATASQLLARMVDSLQGALLNSLGTVTHVAAVRRAGIGCPTSSESAKHRYLQAEQFFRQSNWDSAHVAYSDVVASDSKCALAYHRLADVSAWSESADDPTARTYQLNAGRTNHGLAPRDSLLITADSLDAALRNLYDDERAAGSHFWAIARRMFETLTEASRRYPGDAEVWYALGDARYHWGWSGRMRTPEVLDAFDSAIALDSGFALSYLHAIELAFAQGDTARGRRYANGYYANRPPGVKADWVRFTMELIAPATAFSPGTRRALETQSENDLLGARLIVDRWPDSLETAVRLSWQMATRTTRESARVAQCVGGHESKWALAQRLAFRGHLRAAACALGRDLVEEGNFVTDLALLGAIDPDTAGRVFDEWLRRAHGSLVSALPWWSARGDSVRLAAAVRVADSVARASRNPATREQAVYTGASARAHLALARRDTTDALRRFRALADTLCIECFLRDQWTTAQLLAARDSVDAAYRILSAWPGEDMVAREVWMTLDRARVAERLGYRDEAIAGYRLVIAALGRGDEGVRPYVQAAREGLSRLTKPGAE